MYLSPLVLNDFNDYSIEPEELNIETYFQDCNGDEYNPNSSNYLSVEVFSELTARNVPQPKGEVYRRSY